MGLCPDSITPCICMSVRFMCSPLITLTSVWCRSCLILTLPHTFQSPKKKAVEQTINPPPPIFPPHGFDLLALDFQPEPGRQTEQPWWGETFLVWPLEKSHCSACQLGAAASSGSAEVGLQTCLSGSPEITMTTQCETSRLAPFDLSSTRKQVLKQD